MTRPEVAAGVADRDLADQTVLVTGSTSGIGREMAVALGRLGATVFLHGRDRERGRETLQAVRDAGGEATLFLADFSDQTAVRELAAKVREAGAVDVLVNNAGGQFREGRLTDDGVEYTIAVNHLAPFLLTHHLFEELRAGAGRVVTTSSGAHRQGSMDFDALTSVDGYSQWGAYSRSKLANVLFTRELARRTDAVTANCFHPGFVPGSAFFRSQPAPIRLGLRLAGLVPGVGTSVERGAARGLYLVASPEVADVSGEYFGRFETSRPASAARDPETAARLWSVSAELVDLPEELALPEPRPAD
jgi:NAD(P)-dependent dehydrogenase (short-subunit alcohol dehydrogenase family)